ncbi:MAG: glycerol-3-phosphate 1-O-acyltransferase PlsY [Candidatus Omnitrophica bacterium]|nr:glycerol-3-phosphate 1-O-acyltransferase PlsY [Candidatus Omnitrophota bacterium]
MPWIILAIVVSYLVGSIPTAFIFGRILKGIDIRKFGSGNVGATNALRVLGKTAGIAVLALDILKGFAMVVFLGDFIAAKNPAIPEEIIRVILALTVVAGHNWTIFLGFKGGKGVATTFGVLAGLALKVAGLKAVVGLAILTWVAVFIIARIVSIASVCTGLSLPIYMALFHQSFILIFLSIILSLSILLRHKSNLKRLFHGRESRIK